MKQSALALFCCLFACAPQSSPKPARFVERHDALSNGVVISEVYGGGGVATSAYKYDFVELFNRGTVAVDVSNWSVQYAGATTGSWQPTSLGSFGLLQPGQSLLVRMGGSASGAGLDLPAHDVTGASLMSATTGKVALVNSAGGLSGNCPSSTSIVDLVGYGAMANCYEGAATPDTSGMTSVSRIGNGCTETDSNANDFTVSGPLPRNSMAGNVVCGSTPVDAGTNPIDAGTNPIDAGSCLVLTTFPIVFQSGGYVAADQTTFGEFSSAAGADVLTLEAYFGAGLTVPGNQTFNTASSYATCDICALLSRGCDSMGVCTKDYFAQAGSSSVTVATQDERNGRLTASLSAVRFVEWDFANDVAVPSGDCVVLTSQNLNVSWGAGPTGGGGGLNDAGTGGGTGGGSGGGTTDAGQTEQDGGSGGGGGATGGKSGCGCTTGGEAALAFLAFTLLRRRR